MIHVSLKKILSIINIIASKSSNTNSQSVDFNIINNKLITFEAFLEKNEKIIFVYVFNFCVLPNSVSTKFVT